jgi:AcrR family transcriptional regulator
VTKKAESVKKGDPMKKMDIRTKFTKKAFKDSLVELMKTTPIQDIPIKAICAGAEVSRATFYTYYDDQYDLLQEIEEETFIEGDKLFRLHISATKKPGIREITVVVQDILQFIASNSNSIQVLLSENGDSGFQKKFFRKGIESVRQFTEATDSKSQDGKMDKYGFVFVVGGVLTLVQEWLKNGMDTPIPDLAKMLARIVREALG